MESVGRKEQEGVVGSVEGVHRTPLQVAGGCLSELVMGFGGAAF